MSPGDPKFFRRQKEIARAKKQEEKRSAKAARRERNEPADDGIAAIQAALDAGVDPRTLLDPDAAAGEDDESEDGAGAGADAKHE